MNEEILRVINEFKSSDPEQFEDQYLNGDCYVFARALVKKFGGNIVYIAVDNHFVACIDCELYDIRGVVPEYDLLDCYDWEQYKQMDPLDADRVEYYCILGKEDLKL